MIFLAGGEPHSSLVRNAVRRCCRSDKVLNQRTESKRDSRIAIPTTGKNNFTIRLRLQVPSDRFQSAAPRYADK